MGAVDFFANFAVKSPLFLTAKGAKHNFHTLYGIMMLHAH